MRLGWRNPRPNDFNGPDERPLKDQFANLQQFMTWPHFTAIIDGGQLAGAAYAKRTIRPLDDPYSLVRNATDDIVVPYDFDTWMFVGMAHAFIATGGAGLYQIGFNVNGVDISEMIEDTYSAGAVAAQRTNVHVLRPVRKGDVMFIKTSAPAAVNIDQDGYVAGFFLPMT
jgi:hypothetical protein